MDQLVNVLVTINNVHKVQQRALHCIPDIGELNQADGPNCPTPYWQVVQPMVSRGGNILYWLQINRKDH